MTKTDEVKKLSEICDKYDYFIVDLWGVVHNGINIFDGIVDVLEELKRLKKVIYFMTNAPRRSFVIEEQLSDFGLKRELYDSVISSGEITWQFLSDKNYKFCYLIGPERDYHLIEGLSYEVTKDFKKVEIIVNTGPWGDDDNLENYKPTLENLVKHNPTMICSNPDKRVIRGEKFMICAGLLAEYYESIGGKVIYYGKPFPEIYNFCLKKISIKSNKKILIIGDSLENDIRGAVNQNLDSLLVTDGIHREVNNDSGVDKEKLNDLIKKKKIYPKYYMRKLVI